ncbi:uncharacterized protein LOC133185084 [Saccostrea echinata]|uniref:uncharacterized protein LOC133185084 n=1 Tax=Saccostrea echinata TaxID=191078 RepID=UPI002A7EC45F|nr:uncharacterized protein LOC133185084 [Saccostrea echinata]
MLQERSHKEVRENIIEQGTYLHQELEKIIQNHLKEAKKIEEEDLSILGKQISDMKSILSEIQKITKENQNLLKTKTIKNVLKHESENERFPEVQKLIELSPPSFVSQRIPQEALSQLFGTLTCSVRRETRHYLIPSATNLRSKREGLRIPEIIRTWRTGLKVSPKISCCLESDDCYVRSSSTIKQFSATGNELNVTKLKSESHFLIDITVSKNNTLFYSDNRDRSVNFVKNNTIKTLITLDGWKPLAICSSSTGDILVSMQTDDEKQSKVVRYSGTTVSQEIQYKDISTPLYSNPLFICENTNFDICISDWDKNSVEVVDSDGEFIFSYEGNRALTKYKDKFNPRGLACDSLSHILITDFLNNLVHIIDHNGHFLRFIDNCNLHCPQDVSVSRDNKLYLVENSKEELKVISYLV